MIKMPKFRAPYLIKKRGIFYLQKRIPQQLKGHYGRAFVRKSLRTKGRLEASKLASQLVRGSQNVGPTCAPAGGITAGVHNEWVDTLITLR